MNIYENELYLQDIRRVTELQLPWEQLNGRSIMISGATGMIGSFLIDVLMEKGLDLTVYALGRNAEKAQKRFARWWNDSRFVFVQCDINEGITLDAKTVDYVFHAASNTHPMAYATDPIGTITTNIIGTDNLLSSMEHAGCCLPPLWRSTVRTGAMRRNSVKTTAVISTAIPSVQATRRASVPAKPCVRPISARKGWMWSSPGWLGPMARLC